MELKVDNKNRKPKLHLISFMSRWLLNNISLLIDFRFDVQKIVAIFKNKRFIVYVITNEATKKKRYSPKMKICSYLYFLFFSVDNDDDDDDSDNSISNVKRYEEEVDHIVSERAKY